MRVCQFRHDGTSWNPRKRRGLRGEESKSFRPSSRKAFLRKEQPVVPKPTGCLLLFLFWVLSVLRSGVSVVVPPSGFGGGFLDFVDGVAQFAGSPDFEFQFVADLAACDQENKVFDGGNVASVNGDDDVADF